jgi:DNA-binding MurR/RpiR family transcriptional regulator
MSANGMPTPSVAERTRELLGSLSPGERKVARALLAAYPVAGLEAVADLAERAKVSAPTVLRFAGRLGYTSPPLPSSLAEALKLLVFATHVPNELLRTYLDVKQSELDAVADL